MLHSTGVFLLSPALRLRCNSRLESNVVENTCLATGLLFSEQTLPSTIGSQWNISVNASMRKRAKRQAGQQVSFCLQL